MYFFSKFFQTGIGKKSKVIFPCSSDCSLTNSENRRQKSTRAVSAVAFQIAAFINHTPFYRFDEHSNTSMRSCNRTFVDTPQNSARESFDDVHWTIHIIWQTYCEWQRKPSRDRVLTKDLASLERTPWIAQRRRVDCVLQWGKLHDLCRTPPAAAAAKNEERTSRVTWSSACRYNAVIDLRAAEREVTQFESLRWWDWASKMLASQWTAIDRWRSLPRISSRTSDVSPKVDREKNSNF